MVGEELQRDDGQQRSQEVRAVGGLRGRKRTSDLDDLGDLERQGLIRLGTGRLPKDFWKVRCPRDPEGRVLKALLEERESTR